jgi:hypothetical protein
MVWRRLGRAPLTFPLNDAALRRDAATKLPLLDRKRLFDAQGDTQLLQRVINVLERPAGQS